MHPSGSRSSSRSVTRRSSAIRFQICANPRTLALQAGVHPKIVSERLGHGDVGVTLNTYSHAIPALEEEAAARVAALVFGA